MSTDKYILDADGEPIPAINLMAWAEWFGDGDRRRVALDVVGEVRVSTVFLGIDHGFGDEKRPVLWETMVFGGDNDGEQERYTSLADARAGHQAILERCRARATKL